MKPKYSGALWLVWIVFWAVGAGAGDARPAPRINLPYLEHTFAPVVDGQSVVHDFVVRNQGQADLEIYRVRTG